MYHQMNFTPAIKPRTSSSTDCIETAGLGGCGPPPALPPYESGEGLSPCPTRLPCCCCKASEKQSRTLVAYRWASRLMASGGPAVCPATRPRHHPDHAPQFVPQIHVYRISMCTTDPCVPQIHMYRISMCTTDPCVPQIRVYPESLNTYYYHYCYCCYCCCYCCCLKAHRPSRLSLLLTCRGAGVVPGGRREGWVRRDGTCACVRVRTPCPACTTTHQQASTCRLPACLPLLPYRAHRRHRLPASLPSTTT